MWKYVIKSILKFKVVDIKLISSLNNVEYLQDECKICKVCLDRYSFHKKKIKKK